jgi:hypothetical protein
MSSTREPGWIATFRTSLRSSKAPRVMRAAGDYPTLTRAHDEPAAHETEGALGRVTCGTARRGKRSTACNSAGQ